MKKRQEIYNDDDVVVHKFSYLILKLVVEIQTKNTKIINRKKKQTKMNTEEFIHISNDLNGHRLITEC